MAKIQITGEDINSIVYKYLLERGYKHTAFALESEAKIDPEKVYKRKITPYYLPTLLEKALLLKYLELHPVPEETHVCEAPLRLLEDHQCEVVQRSMLGKREVLRRSQIELSKEILDSIQEVDRQTSERRYATIPPITGFDDFKITNPPMISSLTKSKSAIGERKEKKETSKREENPQMQKSHSMNDDEGNGAVSIPLPLKPNDWFSQIETKTVPLNFTPDLLETYYDGTSTNLLLKVKEGNSSCFFVSQISSFELIPLFMLPQEVVNQAQQSISLTLRKHLILVSETGEMSFINYQSSPPHDS